MLDKHWLSHEFVRETIVAIVASYKQNNLQDICQSSNVINIISSEIIQYKSANDKLTRKALHHQAKEATLMRKVISLEATAASSIEKFQVQDKKVDDLADELAQVDN